MAGHVWTRTVDDAAKTVTYLRDDGQAGFRISTQNPAELHGEQWFPFAEAPDTPYSDPVTYQQWWEETLAAQGDTLG